MKLYNVIDEGGRGKDYDTIRKMAQNINKFVDEDKVQFLGENSKKKIHASHVYGRFRCR